MVNTKKHPSLESDCGFPKAFGVILEYDLDGWWEMSSNKAPQAIKDSKLNDGLKCMLFTRSEWAVIGCNRL